MSEARTNVTKKELDEAYGTWVSFAGLIRKSAISIVVLLILMAFFLL